MNIRKGRRGLEKRARDKPHPRIIHPSVMRGITTTSFRETKVRISEPYFHSGIHAMARPRSMYLGPSRKKGKPYAGVA